MRDERLNAVMNNLLPQVKQVVGSGNNLVWVTTKGHMDRATGEWLIDKIVIEPHGGIRID